MNIRNNEPYYGEATILGKTYQISASAPANNTFASRAALRATVSNGGVVCQDYPQFTEKQSMQTTAASAAPLTSISIDIGKDISHLVWL